MSDQDIVIITEIIRIELAEHQARTGVGPTKLLKNTRNKRPEGLRAHIIDNWISGKNKTLRQSHLDYVCNIWEKLPNGPERVEITTEIRTQLCEHRDRTGIGSHAITTVRRDCPKGLTSGIIQYWLDGKIKTAQTEHLNYVLVVWRELDDMGEL